MNIGFIHPTTINIDGTGSTQSATLLIKELAAVGHDVTVFCRSIENEQTKSEIEHKYDIEVQALETDSSSNKIPQKRYSALGNSLFRHKDEFETFDILHSYAAAIPHIAELNEDVTTPIVVSLTGQGPICPKKDTFYLNSEPCRESGYARCTKCVVHDSLFPEASELYEGVSIYEKYSGLKRLPASGYRAVSRLRDIGVTQSIKQSVEFLDGYHVLTAAQKDIYSSFGFPSKKMTVIPNMLDDRFLLPNRSTYEEPINLLNVGSLQKKKGVQKLIPMMEYLNENYDDILYHLTIVGGGYLETYLKEETRKKNLNITVTGRVPYDKLPKIYASHDIFIYPGICEETFGRVFLEALSTGTPVVGSDVGDVARIIGDAGVITDGSAEALAEGVYELSDSHTLKKQSQKAKEQVKQYQPENVLCKFEKFYENNII